MLKNSRTKITARSGRAEVVVTREFNAQREAVFKAYTDPRLYIQWQGPRGATITLERFEPRNGGTWRYVQRDGDGRAVPFHGVYHEVTAPERIINTFEFFGLTGKGHACLQTSRFEPLPDNRTRLTAQAVFQSVADRDGLLRFGLERSANDSHERLDELLAKL